MSESVMSVRAGAVGGFGFGSGSDSGLGLGSGLGSGSDSGVGCCWVSGSESDSEGKSESETDSGRKVLGNVPVQEARKKRRRSVWGGTGVNLLHVDGDRDGR